MFVSNQGINFSLYYLIYRPVQRPETIKPKVFMKFTLLLIYKYFFLKIPARIYNLKQISRETFNFHGYDIHKYQKILIPHTFSILNISIIILFRNDNF